MRIAAMAAYFSKIENIKNIYPFCKNPLNFLFIKNIKNKLKTNDEFSKNLLGLLRKMESVWEPSSTTTKKGYQTSNSASRILSFSMQAKLISVGEGVLP